MSPMTDTLTDRIDAHLAKAKAATPGPWTDWGLGVVRSGSGAVVGKVLLEARYNSDAAHFAANNPATIEAFCAVAKADEVLAEEARLHIACGRNEKFSRACRELACYPLCKALAASGKTQAALYDALGRSK